MYGYENLHKRLNHNGGEYQQDRMILDKLRSLKASIGRSYQTATIFLQNNQTDNAFVRGFKCLINPDKLKNDYDQKFLSIPYRDIQINKPRVGTTTQGQVDVGIKCGDVFYWKETDSYWIVYLQFKEELAYFRADIRMCEKEVEINGHTYHVYFKGPDETTIQWNQKDNIEWNDLNYSAEIYITQNEETLEYFHRFAKVKIDGKKWEVVAQNSASGEGIIKVALMETFSNELEDKTIEEKEQQQELTEEIREQRKEEGYPSIMGDNIVYPYDIKEYTIENAGGGRWVLATKKARILQENAAWVKIEIVTGKSGFIDLQYYVDGNIVAQLPITIESI